MTNPNQESEKITVQTKKDPVFSIVYGTGASVNDRRSPDAFHIRILGDGNTFYKEAKMDMINKPPHYWGKKLEVIEVIEDFELNFTLGNAIKYILRAGKKNDKKCEDLKKALWYINREINEIE